MRGGDGGGGKWEGKKIECVWKRLGEKGPLKAYNRLK